ncbi:MAG: hypothetical protein KIS78_14690 [Labilithrix sp.]|nr:hypothetical protein [Labilithrix sp.]MCW5833647.1 hypothetical protein [Labilithrix sp.]
MRDERWEHGSDFAYPEVSAGGERARWLPSGASLWHSGRDALRALVRALRPRRALFPSFYCQDVLEAAEREGVEVRAYADGPDDPDVDPRALALGAGDLLVVANVYGIRRAPPPRALPDGVTLVEDHTHDPLSEWARASAADFAFASLRKWLPLADGAVLWSPAQRPTIEPGAFDPSAHARAAAITLDRLTGMLLKQRYLAGEPVSKDAYRARSVAGEGAIGRGEPAPMSPLSRALLDVLPVGAWRAERAQNHRAFAAALGQLRRARLLTARDDERVVPFAAVLCVDDAETRDALRARLVEERIYPAVLWPIDGARAPGIPAAHVELARRVVCLHCDHRYDVRDMERVAGVVRRALEDA